MQGNCYNTCNQGSKLAKSKEAAIKDRSKQKLAGTFPKQIQESKDRSKGQKEVKELKERRK